jgi:hypothetical protein
VLVKGVVTSWFDRSSFYPQSVFFDNGPGCVPGAVLSSSELASTYPYPGAGTTHGYFSDWPPYYSPEPFTFSLRSNSSGLFSLYVEGNRTVRRDFVYQGNCLINQTNALWLEGYLASGPGITISQVSVCLEDSGPTSLPGRSSLMYYSQSQPHYWFDNETSAESLSRQWPTASVLCDPTPQPRLGSNQTVRCSVSAGSHLPASYLNWTLLVIDVAQPVACIQLADQVSISASNRFLPELVALTSSCYSYSFNKSSSSFNGTHSLDVYSMLVTSDDYRPSCRSSGLKVVSANSTTICSLADLRKPVTTATPLQGTSRSNCSSYPLWTTWERGRLRAPVMCNHRWEHMIYSEVSASTLTDFMLPSGEYDSPPVNCSLDELGLPFYQQLVLSARCYAESSCLFSINGKDVKKVKLGPDTDVRLISSSCRGLLSLYCIDLTGQTAWEASCPLELKATSSADPQTPSVPLFEVMIAMVALLAFVVIASLLSGIVKVGSSICRAIRKLREARRDAVANAR